MSVSFRWIRALRLINEFACGRSRLVTLMTEPQFTFGATQPATWPDLPDPGSYEPPAPRRRVVLCRGRCGPPGPGEPRGPVLLGQPRQPRRPPGTVLGGPWPYRGR